MSTDASWQTAFNIQEQQSVTSDQSTTAADKLFHMKSNSH